MKVGMSERLVLLYGGWHGGDWSKSNVVGLNGVRIIVSIIVMVFGFVLGFVGGGVKVSDLNFHLFPLFFFSWDG